MDQDKPVFTGILMLQPQGKLLIKKSWTQKWCLLYKASKFGIQRLEVYDNLDEAATGKSTTSRIITLENCIKITRKSPTSFAITTKTAIYEFFTVSPSSLDEWFTALQSVAFSDNSSRITSIEEDNDLYCSSGEGIFNVKLHSSEASTRCGLQPTYYTLVLTSNALQLRSRDDSSILYTWPYHFIRRYGYKEHKFTFEAGRKCESGEGTFHLEHPSEQEIFRCLASRLKSMKKLLNGESTSSLLDCANNQFHAALSMEARSRSPLPPSLTIDSQNIKPPTSFEKKTKPLKPPRKTVFKNDSPENSTKYDQVEYRNEAWKVLGVDDVKHTENFAKPVDESDEYISCARSQGEQAQPQKAPNIISNPPTKQQDESYDRLNFFSSITKFTDSTGYKQISVNATNPSQPSACPHTFNDYDEVQPLMESVRIADDSYLGYAKLRKVPKDPVNHQFHNDDPYAIISKPKRV